jgi:hypothetical protein
MTERRAHVAPRRLEGGAMSTVTLEQVEALAMQLPTEERLKLAVRICQKVSESFPTALLPDDERRKRQEEWQKLRAQLDAVAALWPPGKRDAAEEIRQMRAERDEQIWPSR